jgi:large subunit ribosomal protein L10
MNNNLQLKKDKINGLEKIIKNAKSFLLFKYHGLNAKAMGELRKDVHNNGGNLYIHKNNILNRSLKSAGFNEISEIKDANAIIVTNNDEIAPFKCLNKIICTNEKIKFNGGVMNSKYVHNDDFLTIANLSSKETLIVSFLSCIQNPILKFAFGLKSISEKL